MGGLGNQLSQYAIARKLSLLLGVEFKLDLITNKYFKKDLVHTYQLDKLNTIQNIATPEEINKFKKTGWFFYKIFNQLKRFFGLNIDKNVIYNSKCYIEKEFSEDVLNLPDNTYLMGYFGDIRYYNDIRDILLQDFSLKEAISLQGSDVLEKIKNSDSVSIHFRRGDFLTNSEIKDKAVAINSDEYYKNAIKYITQNVENPEFFIFSDEIDYLKENFKLSYPVTYMDFNPPQRGYEDMYLMSQCKYNILAGMSSFSSWAAYLNNNPDKVIIVPQSFPTYPNPTVKI
jgi:hypothetical protein